MTAREVKKKRLVKARKNYYSCDAWDVYLSDWACDLIKELNYQCSHIKKGDMYYLQVVTDGMYMWNYRECTSCKEFIEQHKIKYEKEI